MHDKNHEGYHDPTASEAIRRADREHKRQKRLTYLLGKTRDFQEAAVKAGRHGYDSKGVFIRSPKT